MWPARPALERRKRPHVGQGTVGAKSADEAALAFRAARLLCAAVMRLLSIILLMMIQKYIIIKLKCHK